MLFSSRVVSVGKSFVIIVINCKFLENNKRRDTSREMYVIEHTKIVGYYFFDNKWKRSNSSSPNLPSYFKVSYILDIRLLSY